MTPRQKIQAARVGLILDAPFFGVLALRLAVVEDETCGTAWTDGRSLGYDPEFVNRLTTDETVALVAHEVMHVAAGHPWRRDNRENDRANMAMDLAINPILKDAGFRLPAGALLDAQFHGKSFEWIYARLPTSPKGDNFGKGTNTASSRTKATSGSQGAPTSGSVSQHTPGASQGGKNGMLGPGQGGCDVRDAPEDAGDGTSEADWQQAVQQAAQVGKGRGTLPASLTRFVETAAKSRVDWPTVLHRFVQQAACGDYSWSRPNTRYIPSGLYLPSLRSEEMGPIAVAVDTSGSIDAVLLSQFAAELRSVIDDVRPLRTTVIYCDAKVHRVDTFERDDVLTLNPIGGGGTASKPALDYVDAIDEPPVAVIYLTDLDIHHREKATDMPILWASTHVRPVPYGEVVVIE